MITLGVNSLEISWMVGFHQVLKVYQNVLLPQLPTLHCCLSAGPTCVAAGLCRSAVIVAEEAEGTSSVGDFKEAGLAFLPSAGGSIALGVEACCP